MYSDFFNIIEGDLTDLPINFTMEFSPGITESEVESLVKDVSIIITIQKGIVFDIFANVINGDVSIKVPFKVRINSIHFILSNGNIFYDLNRCINTYDLSEMIKMTIKNSEGNIDPVLYIGVNGELNERIDGIPSYTQLRRKILSSLLGIGAA